MAGDPLVFRDLALVLLAAVIGGALAWYAGQPLVLGYVLGGGLSWMARAHGLATGPMAGFDADAVTAEFLPGGRERALLVVNLGHPGENPWHPRLPRLDEAEVVRWA